MSEVSFEAVIEIEQLLSSSEQTQSKHAPVNYDMYIRKWYTFSIYTFTVSSVQDVCGCSCAFRTLAEHRILQNTPFRRKRSTSTLSWCCCCDSSACHHERRLLSFVVVVVIPPHRDLLYACLSHCDTQTNTHSKHTYMNYKGTILYNISSLYTEMQRERERTLINYIPAKRRVWCAFRPVPHIKDDIR